MHLSALVPMNQGGKMKTKIIWISCSLLFFASVAKADVNKQLLCANFMKQAANSFELSPAKGEYKWEKGSCRNLSLERAEAMYYLLTSCLQTKCGDRDCRVSEKEFKNTSCPYAPDYIDIPNFLKGFAGIIEKYGEETDAWESHMNEMTATPLCIVSSEVLRNAALGCENIPAGNAMNASAKR